MPYYSIADDPEDLTRSRLLHLDAGQRGCLSSPFSGPTMALGAMLAEELTAGGSGIRIASHGIAFHAGLLRDGFQHLLERLGVREQRDPS
jgi:hypothetical protein